MLHRPESHVRSLPAQERRHHEQVLNQLGLRHWAEFDREAVAAAHQQHLELQGTDAHYPVEGADIHCPPGVYHATPGSSTSFLLRHLNGLAVGKPPSILEIGVGSGAILISLARRLGAGRYVGVDISRMALAAAAENAARNGVEITLHHSDLFTALAGERFDAIFFNAPLYDRVPRNDLERHMLCDPGGRVLHRFVAGVADHLKPGGAAYVTVSNIGLIAPLDAPPLHIGLKGAELFDTGVIRALISIRSEPET